MPPARRRPPQPKPAEQHAEWLRLLAPDGPFLSTDVLTAAFPQGLPEITTAQRQDIRDTWNNVQASPELMRADWIEHILARLLRWTPRYRADPDHTIPGPDPDFVLTGPGQSERREPRLLCYQLPWATSPTRASADGASPAEQAAARCRASGVPLALVTDGRLWALVHARPGEPTSTAVFDAEMWLEEPLLLRAFTALLSGQQVQVPPVSQDGHNWTDTTAALFARTAESQDDLTEELGNQVRQAVELLIAEFARIDRETSQGDSHGVLAGVSERDIYRGGLTVLMRMVFLLYAEEQRLLPTDDLYADHYSITRLYDQLAEERNRHGEEISDRRAAAWPRLLALFAGIYHGAEHPDLRLPAYGGTLFDPDRFTWLVDFAVTDRVVFQILDALLMLRPRRGRGAPVRVSYKGLGVEDIGHIYEGLLEFSCLKITEPHLGLTGKQEPELPLRELEEYRSAGEEELKHWLREQADTTPRRVDRSLRSEPEPRERAALRAACDSDADLAERVEPFWGMLRTDLRGEPAVFPAHSVLFTQVGQRRATGTHYTPRVLADEVVRHTLDPLAYDPGPAQGAEPHTWSVKPAEKLLRLTVCDPAMGSGAFLVAACRHLADRVVEAWQRDGVPTEVREALGPGYELDDLRLHAKRHVASSCLYGVDRDDMAVELAKLSLWLETLAKNKPFSFLDHALRQGDSLVGLVDEEQVRSFHTDPEAGYRQNLRLGGNVEEHIDAVLSEITELRGEIERTPVADPADVEHKTHLLHRADERTSQLRVAADAVVAAALGAERFSEIEHAEEDPRQADAETKKLNWQGAYDELLGRLYEDVLSALSDTAEASPAEQRLRERVTEWLTGPRTQPVRPFHWALEFPEVMRHGGFDAVVGNPPFMGGQRLTGTLGTDIREYLVVDIAGGKRGSADLCSYFLLRNLRVAPEGRTGIIATNTIAQGDTREVGLDQITQQRADRPRWNVYRAVKSQQWPGTANVHVSLVWAGHAGKSEKPVLDGNGVSGITPSLDPRTRVTGTPWKLVANQDQAFQGATVLGDGFILEPERAHELIERNPKNREVLFPYLNGQDLNSRPDCSPSRWVINFGNMSEEEAREYPEPFEIIERDVKPMRMRNNRKVYRDYWWQYAEKRPAMQEAISNLDRVLVMPLVSKIGAPVFCEKNKVFSHMLGVFALGHESSLAVISSEFHFSWWTVKGNSTLESRLRYTPSDGYENFPWPEGGCHNSGYGTLLENFRNDLMLSRNLGLTKLYNLVHDPSHQDQEIDRLREIHAEIDEAVKEAYGWTDLDLRHDHYATPQGTRWTVHPETRTEILDRLLELNFQRHAEEERKGIWPPVKKKRPSKPKKPSKTSENGGFDDGALFPPDDVIV